MTEAIPSCRRVRHTWWRDLVGGRNDARLDWRQAISTAELPANVRALIERVVSHTRLWRREKLDVALELVAHFQDGLEMGGSAEQLVASFGDPEQAARLIRRAKRRGRSVGWQIWQWTCFAGGVLLLAYVALALYYVTGRPTIKVNYLAVLNERAKAASEEERAWPVYRQALSGLLVTRKWPTWMNEAELTPAGTAWPEAVKWIEVHQAPLAQLREALQRPELGLAVATSPKAFSPADQRLFFDPADPRLAPQFPTHDKIEHQMLISVHFPHAEPLKNAARLLRFDALRAALAGDGETALADVRTILGIADHLQQTGCLIMAVAAGTIQQLAYAAVQDVLSHRPDVWSPGQLRDLAHAIAISRIDWRGAFDGEHAMFLDTMQRFYTDDGNGDGHLAFRGPAGLNVFDAMSRFTGGDAGNPFAYDGLAAALMPAANLYIASRKEMTDLYETLLERTLLRLDTPLWKQADGRSYDAEFLAEHGSQWALARHCFVSLMLPAYEQVRNKIAECDGHRAGALLGIALELYRREHKAWPESLDELSPRWLPSVPVDPMTGDALGYRIVDERPVVYSVGTDRDNDGGRVPPESAVGTEGSADEGPLSLPKLANVNGQLAAPGAVRTPPDGDWIIWRAASKN